MTDITEKNRNLEMFRGDYGETIVAYELMKRGWDVYKSMGGHGFDLIANKYVPSHIIRNIEVKTTDPNLKQDGPNKRQLTVLMTCAERERATHLVFYILPLEIESSNVLRPPVFFVIPRKAFPSSGSVTVTLNKEGFVNEGTTYEDFRNNWGILD